MFHLSENKIEENSPKRELSLTQKLIRAVLDENFAEDLTYRPELSGSDFMEHIDFVGDNKEKELFELLQKKPDELKIERRQFEFFTVSDEEEVDKKYQFENFRLYSTVKTKAVYKIYGVKFELDISRPNGEQHRFKIQCFNDSIENCKKKPLDDREFKTEYSLHECCNIL